MTLTRVDPRIERTKKVVLDAAVEVIGARGFSGATIDAISRSSGVARSTIYRHWPDRVDLLLEAFTSRIGTVGSLVTGDLRSDLLAIGSRLAELLTSEPIGSVVASLILESRHDAQLEELRRRFVEVRQAEVLTSLAAAVENGRLPAGIDAGGLASDIAAPIFFRALILRAPIDRVWIEAHVDRWLTDNLTEETSPC